MSPFSVPARSFESTLFGTNLEAISPVPKKSRQNPYSQKLIRERSSMLGIQGRQLLHRLAQIGLWVSVSNDPEVLVTIFSLAKQVPTPKGRNFTGSAELM